MINISHNGTVMVKRGDTFNVPLFINIGTEEEPMRLDFTNKPWLKVHFNIESAGKDGPVLFTKTFTNLDVNEYGDIMVLLTSDETKKLRSGVYEYTIYVTDDSDVEFNYTVTPNKMFYLF